MDWPNQFKFSAYDENEKEKIIVFESGQVHYAVSEVPIAIPSSDLEFPTQTAWYWKNAQKDISSHKAHLIVFASGKTDKMRISENLTKLMCSLIRVTDSIGVYWGSSSQVIQSEMFISFANTLRENNHPIPIWIKTTGYQNEDKTFYLYTIGLKASISLKNLDKNEIGA